MDLDIDHNLKLEGIARDIIRFIQQNRKESGFEVTDKIETEVITSEQIILEAINKWNEFISEQTLSHKLIVSNNQSQVVFGVEIDGNTTSQVGLIIKKI